MTTQIDLVVEMLKQIDSKVDGVADQVTAVKEQVTVQNGRIGKLELYRAGLEAVAGVKGKHSKWWAALGVAVIATLLAGAITIIDHILF